MGQKTITINARARFSPDGRVISGGGSGSGQGTDMFSAHIGDGNIHVTAALKTLLVNLQATATNNTTISIDSITGLRQILNSVSGAFSFQGSCTAAELEEKEKVTGHVWQVGDKEFACNGTEWVELGFNVDLSSYVTESVFTAALNNYITIEGLNSELNKYVLSSALSELLASYVQTSALEDYALASSLSDYVSIESLTSTLSNYVLSSSLNDYVTTASLTGALSGKVDTEIDAIGGGKALIFNEADGGGTQVRHPLANGNVFQTFVGLNDNDRQGEVTENDILGQIYALEIGSVDVNGETKSHFGLKLNIYKDRLCYFPAVGPGEAANDPEHELAVKADIKTAVNPLISRISELEGAVAILDPTSVVAQRASFISNGTTETPEVITLETNKRYVAIKPFTATLPLNAADGSMIYLYIKDGSADMTVVPETGCTVENKTDSLSVGLDNEGLSLASANYIFVYDLKNHNWILL